MELMKEFDKCFGICREPVTDVLYLHRWRDEKSGLTVILAMEEIEASPMRQDRIYKSLPMDDFMDQCSFVFAKGGYYLLPLIQEVNHERKVRPESDEVLKKRFLERATEIVPKEDINVFDSGNYYTVWIKIKA